MPIAALPQTTVRAIGSTAIISDPCSIVKELLDNALDAAASSVTIEISQNTVDVIQVKDNGHGIPSTDYAFVCKRAFTSKIHTVEDLRKLGGKSLGFRGEALASAAEVSGSLAVATRVETEPVGSSMQYARNGELTSTDRVSHPVGTTVRIADLFKHIPVRRQTAVKNSSKTILKIRKMVQAYAMARPSNRLSFRILKAKNENSNSVYAPDKDATLVGAALKIAGTEVASNCILEEWPRSTCEDETQGESNLGFRLVALLPKLAPGITKLNNSGQYISIDGRPVSAGKGIGQDIVKLHKTYLRSATSHPTITDPFLCIHIQCPEASYDVNVEPSKDDVLFEDQQAVLPLVEDLFRNTYGQKLDTHGLRHGAAEEDSASARPNGFELLLSGNPNEPTSLAYHLDSSPLQEPRVAVSSFARPGPPNRTPPANRSAVRRGFNNPRFKQPNNLGSSSLPSATTNVPNQQHNGASFQARRGVRDTSPEARQATVGSLPSPVSSMSSPVSNTTFCSPIRTRPSASAQSPIQTSPITPVHSQSRQRERDRERNGNGSLDTWFLKSSHATRRAEITENHPEEESEPSLAQLSQQRFGPANVQNDPSERASLEPSRSQLIQTTPEPSLEPASEAEPPQTPSYTPHRATEPATKRRELPVLEKWSARLHNLPDPDENPELQKALEYEARKKRAIQEWRLQIKSHRDLASTTKSPHLNRYLAARAALSSNPEPRPDPDPDPSPGDNAVSNPQNPSNPVLLSPHDPRAYLIRLQNTTNITTQQPNTSSKSNPKRIPTNKLPFERIPDGYDLHNLSMGLNHPTDMSFISAYFTSTSKEDLYTRSATQNEDPVLPVHRNPSVIELWSRRLSALMRTQYRYKTGEGPLNDIDVPDPDLQFDFSGLCRVSDDIATS